MYVKRSWYKNEQGLEFPLVGINKTDYTTRIIPRESLKSVFIPTLNETISEVTQIFVVIITEQQQVIF